MDDERLPEKIAIIRRVLCDALGGQEIEYLSPRETGNFYWHLFRARREGAEHRLLLEQAFLEDCAVNEVEVHLKVHGVPTLFTEQTERDVVLDSMLSKPRLRERPAPWPGAGRGR